MSRTITVSDDLYTRLERAACKRGLANVEQLLEKVDEAPTVSTEELRRRREAGEWVDALRAEMIEKYGLMPDSADLVREDRER
jgi:predicted CopG family antitoxin